MERPRPGCEPFRHRQHEETGCRKQLRANDGAHSGGVPCRRACPPLTDHHNAQSIMKKRITIIEDIAAIRDGFVAALESTEKYHVVNAYGNCESALLNLHADMPDVVLMDIELPGINGIEGTAKIKKALPN